MAIAAAASAVLLGYRSASAAGAAKDPGVARVCVAGLRLALDGGREEGSPVGDAICEVPGAPLGLPGERLLAAAGPEGGVLAVRSREPAEPALASAVRALSLQGWEETPASKGARARGAATAAAEMSSTGGALFVTAAPVGRGSVVVAAVLPRAGTR